MSKATPGTSSLRIGYLVLGLLLTCLPNINGRAADDTASAPGSPTSAPAAKADPPVVIIAPVQKKKNSVVSETEQAKTYLADHGLTVGFSLKSDISRDFSGNAANFAVGHALLESTLALDLQRAGGWKGGTAMVSLHQYAGGSTSAMTGDAQGFSNIDGQSSTYLYEAWFQQTLFDGKLRLKAGRVDANTEFARVENGSEFLNSSMGFSPTIFYFPTYPRPRMSANIFVAPTEHFYGGFGIYDAIGGTMPIGEVGGKWAGKTYPGRLGVGFWRYNGKVMDWDGDAHANTSGMYVVLDQTLWREKGEATEGQGVGMFLQYGSADPYVCDFSRHIGAGLQWTGALRHRDKDVLAIGLSRVRLTDMDAGVTNANEMALESLYKYQLNHWLSFTPDFQYIRNAGGIAHHEPFVGTLRMAVTF